MKKSLALLFLSFTIACSAWAEKYEYVKLKGSESPVTNLSDYGWSNVNVWDSFTLESGDVAECISSNTNNYHYVLDGDFVHRHDSAWGNGYAGFKSIFAGPCTIYLAGTASNSTGQHETWRIKRASDSGSTTLAWNGTEWEGSSDGSQQANNDSSGGIDPGILSPQYLEDQPKRP